MENKLFKIIFYIVLIILIILFFTKDLNLFTKTVKNPNDILVLINNKNKLPDNYIPSDLVAIDTKYAYENKLVRKEVKIAFENLSKDALKDNMKITVVSAYRDYNYQKKLYDYYVSEKGKSYANKCSAKPGFSEHQTGLAIDVQGSNKDYNNFENTKEFEWMKNNAHKYGFILRYPKGKENITGFKYEPWHYRYVGIETATIIYNQNITLEEFKKNNG